MRSWISAVLVADARAYLREIERPLCVTCGRLANKTLFNGVNAAVASYCNRHADAALKRMQGE